MGRSKCSRTQLLTSTDASAPESNIPRPPRLASSSNSPHQSDTPSIMQFLTILLLAAPAVYACGDNSYRCKSPDATVDQMWQRKIATARTGPSTTAIPTATTSRSSRASARRKARAGIGPSVKSGISRREVTGWSRFGLTLIAVGRRDLSQGSVLDDLKVSFVFAANILSGVILAMYTHIH